jgi:hypothetical protein
MRSGLFSLVTCCCGALVARGGCPDIGKQTVPSSFTPATLPIINCPGSGLSYDSFNIGFAATTCLGPYTLCEQHEKCGGASAPHLACKSTGSKFHTVTFKVTVYLSAQFRR